ncbi:hypothetical protein ACLOJK_005188 [Asimina triloba]
MEPPSTHRRRVENRQIHADYLLHLARRISDLQTASSGPSLIQIANTVRPPPFGRSTNPSMTATMESISMDEASMKWATPLESADINKAISMQASTQRLLPLWTAGGFHQHRLQAKPDLIVGQKSSSTIFRPAADQANLSSKGSAFRTMADCLPTISSRHPDGLKPIPLAVRSRPHCTTATISTASSARYDFYNRPQWGRSELGSTQMRIRSISSKASSCVHSAEVTCNARSISHKPDPSVSLPSQATPDPKPASLTIRHQSASTKSWLIPPTIDHGNQHKSPASIHGYPTPTARRRDIQGVLIQTEFPLRTASPSQLPAASPKTSGETNPRGDDPSGIGFEGTSGRAAAKASEEPDPGASSCTSEEVTTRRSTSRALSSARRDVDTRDPQKRTECQMRDPTTPLTRPKETYLRLQSAEGPCTIEGKPLR